MNDLLALWQVHKDEGWPNVSSPHEGALMTLDTVISGCVVYYLDHQEGLDAQRRNMLDSCLADIEELLPELPTESRDYFERLRDLGGLLRDAQQDV